MRVAARREGSSLITFYPSETALKRVTTKFVKGNPDELSAMMEKFCAAFGGADNELTADAKRLIDAENPVVVFDPANLADAYIAQEIQKACSKVKLVPAKAKNNSVGIVDMALVLTLLKISLRV